MRPALSDRHLVVRSSQSLPRLIPFDTPPEDTFGYSVSARRRKYRFSSTPTRDNAEFRTAIRPLVSCSIWLLGLSSSAASGMVVFEKCQHFAPRRHAGRSIATRGSAQRE